MLKNKSINLYITENHIVSDFTPVHISELQKVSNGSVDTMICNFLDELTLEQRNAIFLEMSHKLKKDGLLKLRFIDLDTFGIDLYRNRIDFENFNQILNAYKSMWDQSFIVHLCSQLPNLRILENNISGLFKILTVQRIK
jgi:hypothetical protein